MNKFLKSIASDEGEIVYTHRDLKVSSGGRPRKLDEDRKTEKIFISLTKLEKSRLEELANAKEMSLGSFIRLALRGSKIL